MKQKQTQIDLLLATINRKYGFAPEQAFTMRHKSEIDRYSYQLSKRDDCSKCCSPAMPKPTFIKWLMAFNAGMDAALASERYLLAEYDSAETEYLKARCGDDIELIKRLAADKSRLAEMIAENLLKKSRQ